MEHFLAYLTLIFQSLQPFCIRLEDQGIVFFCPRRSLLKQTFPYSKQRSGRMYGSRNICHNMTHLSILLTNRAIVFVFVFCLVLDIQSDTLRRAILGISVYCLFSKIFALYINFDFISWENTFDINIFGFYRATKDQ